jgi:hypothetical protein
MAGMSFLHNHANWVAFYLNSVLRQSKTGRHNGRPVAR